MKLFLVAALALVAAVAAAPAEPEPVKIVRSNFDQQPNGAYIYSFETENGIVHDETGEVKQVNDEDNKPHDVVVMRGSYKYTAPDGQLIEIAYEADENGFRPTGDAIPKVSKR